MKKLLFGLFALAVVALLGREASAGVTTYSSRAAFNGQGTIAYNSNFDDFGVGFGYPGPAFTRGDVTYDSTENLTWGSITGYTTTQPLIGNNYWTPISATIATGPQYDMFGFDIGTYNSSPISIDIYTNLGTYSYPGLTIANSALGQLEFLGFVASAGEYFTGFEIRADDGPGNLPGLTNVAVGDTNGTHPVPEPATLTLCCVGLIGFAARNWRRRKVAA